jgi:hypothetical protein
VLRPSEEHLGVHFSDFDFRVTVKVASLGFTVTLPQQKLPSWEHARMQGERIFFSADAKLPQDTPKPIADLRKKELYSIQARTPH